jgi:hypothetical protein
MWKLFNLKKLYEVEVKEYYQIKMSKRFAAFDSLYDKGNIKGAWEVSIREYIKISRSLQQSTHFQPTNKSYLQ